jgi:hypothetical protein
MKTLLCCLVVFLVLSCGLHGAANADLPPLFDPDPVAIGSAERMPSSSYLISFSHNLSYESNPDGSVSWTHMIREYQWIFNVPSNVVDSDYDMMVLFNSVKWLQYDQEGNRFWPDTYSPDGLYYRTSHREAHPEHYYYAGPGTFNAALRVIDDLYPVHKYDIFVIKDIQIVPIPPTVLLLGSGLLGLAGWRRFRKG